MDFEEIRRNNRIWNYKDELLSDDGQKMLEEEVLTPISEIIGVARGIIANQAATIKRLEEQTPIAQELQKLSIKYNELLTQYNCKWGNGFDPDEIKKAEKIIKKHYKTCKCGSGVSGGDWRWVIVPTGIGTFKYLEHSCGEHFDISNDV